MIYVQKPGSREPWHMAEDMWDPNSLCGLPILTSRNWGMMAQSEADRLTGLNVCEGCLNALYQARERTANESTD